MTRAIFELTPTDEVLVLNSLTLRDAIEANKMLLISFFHKLIPSCARFVHIFEEMLLRPQTAQSARNSFETQFAQIDVMENAAVCQTFNITSYPAIMLFQGMDKIQKYNGVLEEAHIMSYLTRQTSPIVSILTPNTLPDFKVANSVVVVGYLATADKQSQDAFTTLATDMHNDFLFGLIYGEATQLPEQTTTPSIVICKRFEGQEEEHEILKFLHDVNLMRTLVKTASRPLVVEFRPELHDDYFNLGIPLGYILINSVADRKRLANMVRSLAKQYKNQIVFGTVDKKDIGRFRNWADEIWFEMEHWPTWPSFAIREPIKNLRFPFDKRLDLTEKELSKFVKAFKEGKLMPTIKSEPLPDEQKSPVIDVVALNYDNVVLDNAKDVLLEFCTDWCPGCKKSRSTYEGLATLYASDETLKSQVTIATMNFEKNDCPDRDVLGVPWFKLFPAHKKESASLYFGPITLEGMAGYIRDHGTHKAYPKFDSVNTITDGVVA
ncbi:uncharacterized protein LY89DRAFT_665735 [Mollisia scopiformis]|uniref:Protein disulfide-isomerase n=1 Tax=Mollisia scopiformis TaxID=149040 RepID=A0A194XM23_MOLSC|nr:uncharacterized protein LY89DRAFT_665735 [Mollisia scopiformis]KUJ21295.1 hypothetical protein LY89DRAFT_665735 [Mollisia scopiformis]